MTEVVSRCYTKIKKNFKRKEMIILNILLLTASAVSNSAYDVISGFYNKKKADPYKYCLCIAVAVLLFFLFTSGFNLNFKLETLFWAILFGLCYFFTNVLYQASIRYGGVSLTALVMSYSLVIPTFFALIAYGEEPSWFFYLGLLFLFASLFFIGVPRNENKQPVKLIWFVIVGLGTLANGGCSLFFSHYQRLSGGNYGAEFMIIGMAIVIVLMTITILLNKKTTYEAKGSRAFLGLLAGGLNGLLHLINIELLKRMSASLIYPITSSIFMLITVIASRIFFKEKPDKLGRLAVIFGIISVVLLNL
ncbi:MAG: hypothetical protein E7347_03195 [Clostridiales bacterium]|nr:hypothetical protein [Clostridiales bacterium]